MNIMKKLYFLTLTFLLLTTQSYAQDYIRDQKGCLHSVPNKHNTSITWTGNCSNGYANGQGVAQRYKNNRFTMSFNGTKNNGERSYGLLRWVSGNTYRGPFVNGRGHGYGTHTWANGKVYTGNFTNGKQDSSASYKTQSRQNAQIKYEQKRNENRAFTQIQNNQSNSAKNKDCYDSVTFNNFEFRWVNIMPVNNKVFKYVSQRELISRTGTKYIPIPALTIKGRVAKSSRGLTDAYRHLTQQCINTFNKRVNNRHWKYKNDAIRRTQSSLNQCKEYYSKTYSRYQGLMCK